MKISRTIVTEFTCDLPEPRYATLLSAEEYKELHEFISDVEYEDTYDMIPYDWYLRSPGTDDPNSITLADGDGITDETEPDYDDYRLAPEFPFGKYGTGNRPIIVFADSLYDAGLKQGDKFTVFGNPFTVINDKIAILDKYISTDVFDKETTVYENSAIKQRVDDWFDSEIKKRWAIDNSLN